MNVSVRSFYEGKTILLTGTTGFVGKVILEKYLRSLPNIKQIILLMRCKEGQDPKTRFNANIIASPLFDTLKTQMGAEFEPYVQSKIKVVEGDLLQDNLGLSEQDYTYITQNCHVVVNCAASIDFNAKLIDAINVNVLGTLKMYTLAKNCQKLENFVHISTTYVNSDKLGFIEEQIYDKQNDPQQQVQKLLSMPSEELLNQTPAIIGKFPNTYTYTKSLVERILKKIRPEEMSISIVRPSIVGSTCREPIKGWVENLSASSAVFTFVGLGVVRQITSQDDLIGDIVPVDYVSNYTVIAGALFANRKQLSVCNAGTSAKNPMYWKYAREMCEKYWQNNPPEKKSQECQVTFYKTEARMKLVTHIVQTLPAKAYKAISDIAGTQQMKKDAQRAVKVINRAQNIQVLFSYFSGNEWIFDNKNALYLQSIMSEEEKELFWLDSSLIDWREYLLNYNWGLHRFILNENVQPPLVSDVLLQSRRTYFSDIQWALQNGKKFKTRSKAQFKSMVLNSQKVINEINNLIDHRTLMKQNQVKTHKQISFERIRAKCKQDAIQLADEMIADYNMGVLRVLAWSIHKIFRILYEKVIIDDTVLKQIQHHDEKLDGPIIFIPTHRSYIDFIMVSYILFAFKIQCPHIAAAEDFLKMAIVPQFLRMSGAFFLRRKLAEDLQPLYKAMLNEYITRLLIDDCSIEFFIEGTRSRNFKTLAPKFGILGTVVDAVMDDKIKNALIIPLTINYEKVLEEDTYPYELMGEDKVKESTLRLIKASKVLVENYGKIFVEFCEPIPLKQYIQNNQHMERKQIINTLGHEICYSLQERLVITMPTCVAAILLMHRKGIMEHILVSKVEWLVDQIQQRGASVGSVTTKSEISGVSQGVRSAILLLENNLIKSKKTVFEMSVGPLMDFKNILMLSYYRNGLHHIFFQESILCIALGYFGDVKAHQGVNISDFWKEAQYLLKLLHKEHVPRNEIKTYEQFIDFVKNMSFNRKVLSYDETTQLVKIQDEQMFNFLCSQAWSTVESYWITVVYFFTLKQNTHHIVKEFQLPQYIQWFSENMYDEKNVIEFLESCSLDQIKNAVSSFIELGVINIENENNIKNQGIVRLNISETELQNLETHMNKFLKRHFQINAISSPVDLARRTVLGDYQQMNPKL